MIDGVFVWESNNGILTVEIPFGWHTPSRWKQGGKSPLSEWKQVHRKELDELRKMSQI